MHTHTDLGISKQRGCGINGEAAERDRGKINRYLTIARIHQKTVNFAPLHTLFMRNPLGKGGQALSLYNAQS